ncbi:MAG: hypothetical protein JNL58_10190 [Planctomyces sp.]|nr:hypothetical protein [Planctomyces sp.]
MQSAGDSAFESGASDSEYLGKGDNLPEGNRDRSASEGILEQILGLTEEQFSLSEESRLILERLQKVAAEIGDVPFGREAVLLPLVRNILAPFRRLVGTRFDAMCESVVGAIFDDPASRDRVTQLWASLRSRVLHGQ